MNNHKKLWVGIISLTLAILSFAIFGDERGSVGMVAKRVYNGMASGI